MSVLRILLAGSMLLCSAAWSQTDQPDPEDRNHGVARVSLMNGDVAVRRGDSGDLVAASLNAPLLVQDVLQTGQASRAEVQFESATRLRLADNAEVRMAELVAGQFQVQIGRGTTTLSILGEGAGQMEIDTPSVAIRPSRAGEYRVAILEDGTTQITVRAGEARVNSSRGEERLVAGQTMLARGSADNPEFQITGAIGRDEWDVFNERRDQDLQHSESYRYVSRDVPGAEDLDGNGQWVNDPSYGQVWAPRVAPGWAPYRSGRWVWEDYYGWTWVSYDPWGWAPYHYGNWFFGARGWCWYPGSLYARSWFRPALVGFFGLGVNIGWIPLAPFEAFHPWYGRGISGLGGGFRGGVEGFRNSRVVNGVTAMNSRDFANGQFGRFSSVGANELRSASVMRGALPVSPGTGSLRFNDRQTGTTGRNTFSQTRFASHNQPVQTGRGSFGRQTPQPGGGGLSGGSAWQRFGAPAAQSSSRAGVQSTSGWDRFGSPANRSASQGFSPSRGLSQPAAPYRAPVVGRSVQVTPPMVRERAPQSSGSSYKTQPATHQAPGSGHKSSGSSNSHHSR